MFRYLSSTFFVLSVLSLIPAAGAAQVPTVTGPRAIADTISLLFARIAEATTAQDLDRLLGYYETSEALTYVAQGQVIRSHQAFSEILNAQLGGLSRADLRWIDTYVDVLSNDVAVATATYEFVATTPDGNAVQNTGTYMCIYVRQNGQWRVRYSAHTFPPQR
jgi:uncharacterized protein (TIGR02246 family)